MEKWCSGTDFNKDDVQVAVEGTEVAISEQQQGFMQRNSTVDVMLVMRGTDQVDNFGDKVSEERLRQFGHMQRGFIDVVTEDTQRAGVTEEDARYRVTRRQSWDQLTEDLNIFELTQISAY